MPNRDDGLFVSVLPRGSQGGASYLVELDQRNLGLRRVHQIPEHDYWRGEREQNQPVQHCRGLVRSGESLYVALFNCVCEYMLTPSGDLRPIRQFTDRRAVDIHGIDLAGDALFAVATGTDAVVKWDLATGQSEVAMQNGREQSGDFRFPGIAAERANATDWREILDASDHLNDMCLLDDGSMIVCSLRGVFHATDGKAVNVFHDEQALLHDGRLLIDGRVAFTDAARGTVRLMTLSGSQTECFEIADPGEWFVRGLRTRGGVLFVLRSIRVDSVQRIPTEDGPCPPLGARFGVSKLSLESGEILSDAVVDLPDVSGGSVAYAVEFGPQVRANVSE